MKTMMPLSAALIIASPSFIFRSPLEAPHRSKSSDSTRVGTDLSTRRTDAHRQKAAKLEALAAPDYLGITKNFE